MSFKSNHTTNIGRKASSETRKKMSLSHTGDKNVSKKMSVRKKISNSKTGVKRAKFSNEWIENMRKAKLGNKNARGNKGRSKSDVHNRKNSESQMGIKNHQWKCGITSKNAKIRNSREIKIWRKLVFERDDYTCVFCRGKSRKGNTVILNADHIKKFSDYPDLRFSVENGRTLCKDCHKKTDTYGNKKTKNMAPI